MIRNYEVLETNQMISEENLDVRTITLGISLLDCASSDVDKFCENIYNKITNYANNLVQTGNEIQKDFGIPIVNKRISITPIAIAASSCVKTKEDYLKIGKTLDISKCVQWLIEDEYTTGQVISINGGWVII